jgi:hypothetical protein
MNALNGEEILVAWEQSRRQPEQEAAIALLALALPGTSNAELAALPLARRNELLLELRALTLGNRLEGIGECPECGVRLEFALDTATLALGLRARPEESIEELCDIVIRPVNTLDVLACSQAISDDEACSILLKRTVRMSADGLVTAALLQQFESLNAPAEIQVRLQCAACGAHPQLDLDIAHYLIREIGDTARRLMLEIHDLASAYGWSEGTIARMTNERRAAYLEILHA